MFVLLLSLLLLLLQERSCQLLFFFSSRRRHTRFDCDWSSDVCSSDLIGTGPTRISPEGPVPVVDVRRESVHLGGAANVLANLVALGVRASVVGVVGDDRAGERLRAELKEAGAADDALVVDEARPTTTKTRIIA